ncbi:isoprenylcysteine carboxylmethyltransferase family protein [Streptacidiphilus sp. 4-A2]|nr:isoprenylcysteine carboxylmethyltransferase family protein [Streptacidiphilus sp. 4-A2]
MRAFELVFLIGWLVFWVGWLAAAVRSKPGQLAWGRSVGIRLVIAVVVVVLLRLRLFRGHGVTGNPWLEGIGLALFAAGLALAVWARVYIGRNWGTPMSRKADPELVTSGPYRWVRHPIYSGITLAMIGTAVGLSPFWLLAVVLLGGYFVYSATREERYLEQRFPDAYPAYKRSTRMLIPFVF